MKSNRRLFKVLFIIYLFFFNSTVAIENKILFKVNNQIITSVDILNEINYLSFINSDFQKLDKQRMYEVSKNSLIREKIKEIDLKNKFIKMSLEEKYLDDLIKKCCHWIQFPESLEAAKHRMLQLNLAKKIQTSPQAGAESELADSIEKLLEEASK